MKNRKIGSLTCSAIGLGCMNLSHAYGTPPSIDDGEKLLHQALDNGYTLLDTAALYGFGANEELLGKALKGRRHEYILASKCGMFRNDAGEREINGRPEMIKKVCEDSLRRLATDVIDLYYLHRWDKSVPIEESVGALADLVAAGKIREIGLSEVSAPTLVKAHREHPIAAVQSEYSLWSRNVEIAVAETCKKQGTTLVAFSPLGRGFLTGTFDISKLEVGDFRANMPRFQVDLYNKNRQLLGPANLLAEQAECSLAQLTLQWLLAQGEHVVPIPGTQNMQHMLENIQGLTLQVDPEILQKLGQLINQATVIGARYPAGAQADVDTEVFPRNSAGELITEVE